MKPRIICNSLLASALSISSASSMAAGSPHVHGVAKALVAMDSTTLQIEFESPAINIVGFEYAPTNDAEREKFRVAREKLDDGKALLNVQGASCDLEQSTLLMPEFHEDEHDHEDEHNHEEEHEHAHEDERDDNHDHANHQHGNAESSSHSEVKITQTYNCSDPKDSIELVFTVFESFPSLEKISVSWITDSGQGAANLSSENRRAQIR